MSGCTRSIERGARAARAWKRTPFGYLSGDGRYFLERGGRMTHGCNAWLVWERVDVVDAQVEPWRYRDAVELTDDASLAGQVFHDREVEGGWLSEAKAIVEALRERVAEVEEGDFQW